MFGRKKPTKPKNNHVLNKITRDIESSFDDSPSTRTPLEVESYYYTDGRKNQYVTQGYLLALPLDWRRHWPYLDWKKVFEPESEAEEPTSPDNPLSRVSRESDVYQDLFKLNEEAKTRIKAIALGEIPKEDKE